MGHGFKVLALAATLLAPVAASDAATLLVESCFDGPCISGVTGILIDGAHYNVDIREGSFDDLNAAGLFPMFGNSTWAQSAALALTTFFNDVGAPVKVINDIGTTATFFAIPFQFNPLDPLMDVDRLMSNCCGNSGWQTIGVSGAHEAADIFQVYATFVACEPFPGGGQTGGVLPRSRPISGA